MARNGQGPAIGIDLGTTYSCVAVWQHGKAEIIVNGQGNRTTPSYVAFTDPDLLLGDGAKNQAARNPVNTIFDAKRLIGRRFSDEIVQKDIKLWPFKVVAGSNDEPQIVVSHMGEEKLFTAEEISSMVLSHMREIAEAQLGTAIRKAVVTVPAYFNNSQREATKAAGNAAGLDVMRVINEPTAAAIAYSLEKKRVGTTTAAQPKRNVLVFDLGGGTFDVSLLSMDGRGVLNVIATAGDSHLGGVDFDNRLVDYCVEQFERRHGRGIGGNARALRRLRTACERAKRTLSFAVEAGIEVDFLHEGIDFQCVISAAKFEEISIDLFTKCMKLVDDCLRDSGMGKADVHDVVPVGGSTRIPKIQELLKDFFLASKLCKGINPDEAVATGAAIHAAVLGGDEETQKIDDHILSDITPRSLGIHTVGGQMSVLIPKNTPIPAKKQKVFTTSFDNQTIIKFQIFEGERPTTRENNLLGIFELSGVRRALHSVPRITVSFDIDDDGILVVSAEDQETKGKAKITITNHRGCRADKGDIAKVLAVQEEERRRKAEARTALENYAYNVRNALRSGKMGKKIGKKEKERVEAAVDEVLRWSESNRAAAEAEFDMKREELERLCVAVEGENEGFWNWIRRKK